MLLRKTKVKSLEARIEGDHVNIIASTANGWKLIASTKYGFNYARDAAPHLWPQLKALFEQPTTNLEDLEDILVGRFIYYDPTPQAPLE
jgi:hypothetical protein